eukprot:3436059-Pyramimonas_sp.AAC.1
MYVAARLACCVQTRTWEHLASRVETASPWWGLILTSTGSNRSEEVCEVKVGAGPVEMVGETIRMLSRFVEWAQEGV